MLNIRLRSKVQIAYKIETEERIYMLDVLFGEMLAIDNKNKIVIGIVVSDI